MHFNEALASAKKINKMKLIKAFRIVMTRFNVLVLAASVV
jgi:hypothetical protein